MFLEPRKPQPRPQDVLPGPTSSSDCKSVTLMLEAATSRSLPSTTVSSAWAPPQCFQRDFK